VSVFSLSLKLKECWWGVGSYYAPTGISIQLFTAELITPVKSCVLNPGLSLERAVCLTGLHHGGI